MIKNNYKFGNKLKEYREAAGLSQATLARKIGVTPDQISNYEADKINMSMERFVIIYKALNLNLEEILK